MSVLYLVVPLALVIVAVGAGAYLWAVRDGQMDDLETPGLRVIRDDE
jgi:cbb3-type cytochrome oxidase maturation protein